jgi:YidC/Oxa1 family membrane protein insertase
VFFPLGAVVYYVVSNLFSLGQQFYVLRKFPPPVMPGAKPMVVKSTSGKTDIKVKNAVKNGAPVITPTVAAPKVGAKPVNPKKGNAAKRLPSS